jgi:hypothetical protein
MTATRTSLVVLVIASLAAAGCSFLPATVDCGPMDPGECRQRATQVVAEGERGDPTRRLVRLTFTDALGSYSAEYDDGTGTTLIVD